MEADGGIDPGGAGPAAGPVTRTRVDVILLLLALGGLVALVVVRLRVHGIVPVAPDDAMYIGVGRRLIRFRSPTDVHGDLFTIRSWLWPVLSGLASRVVPGDVFRGPKLLGVGFGVVALAGSTVFAYRSRGGVAAVGCAAALGISAVVWEVVGSTRIDAALIGLLVLTILVAAEPSPRRVVVAGVLAGLSLLMKESSALLVFLPLAWYRTAHRPAWFRDARKFWIAFAATVSWWFVFVLVSRGEIFPLQGLSQAVRRDLPRAWEPNVAAWSLVGAWLLAWVVLAPRLRRDVRIRVLAIATAAMVPPTLIAWTNKLGLRQFVGFTVLASIALGIAVGELVARASRGWSVPRANRLRALVGVTILVVAGATAVQLQLDSLVLTAPILDRDTAHWLRTHTSPGANVTTTFRFAAATWARLGGDDHFDAFMFDSGPVAPHPDRQVWIDWSDGAFHSLSRSELVAAARRSEVLILTGRHRLGPIALAAWLDAQGATVGLPHAASFGTLGTPGWVHAYRSHHRGAAAVPTLVTTAALARMPDERVGLLGPYVLAGPDAELAAARHRLAALAAAPPSTLTVPER